MLRRFLLGAASAVPIVSTWMGANAHAAPRCGDCGELKEPHELWMHFVGDGKGTPIDLCEPCLCIREDGFANKQDYEKAMAEHEARRVLKCMGISSEA